VKGVIEKTFLPKPRGSISLQTTELTTKGGRKEIFGNAYPKNRTREEESGTTQISTITLPNKVITQARAGPILRQG